MRISNSTLDTRYQIIYINKNIGCVHTRGRLNADDAPAGAAFFQLFSWGGGVKHGNLVIKPRKKCQTFLRAR